MNVMYGVCSGAGCGCDGDAPNRLYATKAEAQAEIDRWDQAIAAARSDGEIGVTFQWYIAEFEVGGRLDVDWPNFYLNPYLKRVS